MFLKNREDDKLLSLRERFIKNLDKEIQEQNFKESELCLRENLMKKIQKGKLF